MRELKLKQCRLDNRYDVKECLGRGSYAEIYIARDTAVPTDHPHSIVVIKALNLLLQGTADDELDRTLIENFQNEAIALDRVRHPNIINRLGHGTAIDLTETTFHYMVIEYLSGGDLAARCRNHPLPIDETLFYLEQVCNGMSHAHLCGVIHRDIKPHNLLLTADGQTVKIADFGVAKLEATDGAITRVGTNVYAPPEHNPLLHTAQLDLGTSSLHQPQLTPAADVYSLAKTTYTLLAGEPPRRFSHRPIAEFPVSIAGKSWAPAILSVLQKATRDVPNERYQTVKEFWQELSAAVKIPTPALLHPVEATRLTATGDEQISNPQTTVIEAPPQPRFDSTDSRQQVATNGNGGSHPRIVVKLGANQPAQPPAPLVTNQPAQNILNAMSDAPVPKKAVAPKPREWASSRGMRFLVAFILILAFAGMLLATHNYFRGRIPFWGSRSSDSNSTGPGNPRIDVGREVTTITDVYLRPDPGTANSPIGLAETGSRVRVLNANNNWYEVQILEHGRPPNDASLNADRGWINKRYLKLDS
jgi:serine/threonine protein kinase